MTSLVPCHWFSSDLLPSQAHVLYRVYTLLILISELVYSWSMYCLENVTWFFGKETKAGKYKHCWNWLTQLTDLAVGVQSQVMDIADWLCYFHSNLQTVLHCLNQLHSDWPWSSQLSVTSDKGSHDSSFMVRGACSLSGRHIRWVAVFFSSWSCHLHTIFRQATLIIDGFTNSILSAFYHTNCCSFLLFALFNTK